MGFSEKPGQTRRVKAALKKLDGVNDVSFDYLHDNVQVKYDPAKLTVGMLKRTVDKENLD
jgi:copper chaperone CopZ